ncbi:potassium/sodium hyperpolarization-activated cyclic nucleotide-gated channel 1 isoform X2 [Osmia lignaria lignaria]|uniref:potassium/sodium hyperpolarization-activated cyclic nucleotide-gated channel 1 isoform X2 n=2 Tax=Osmia lignaria TaxID=473952 RepID=UPI001478C425|nr:potassium/sodium hyperpolarization-activated cyclic nucleotide-gated channel 1-like isoform X2 [Osmia lignaria]
MREHICGLPKTEVSRLATAASVKDLGCKDVWMHMFQINVHTPRTKMFMHSLAAVSAERRKHANLKHWWIIHPFSYWRFIWDRFMTVVFMISFLTIPFSVCFVIMSHDEIRLDQFNILIYTFCWLDIISNCITGYNNKVSMCVELEPLKIFRQYLQANLIPDVLSSLPWDHITLPWRKIPGQSCLKSIILLNLLPLLKLSRYNYVNMQIFELFTYFEIMHFYYETFSTLMLGFYMMFWSSCLCYLIPVLELHLINYSANECKECWMIGLDSDTIPFRFQYALFIVVEKLAASGYGKYVPKADGHMILSCFLMMIGRVLECYIIVMLVHIKAGRRASKSKFQEIMNQVIAYTIQKQLPSHMKNRLLAYYYYRFRNSYFREKLILQNLSEQLRQEIALQSCHRLVENVAIFKTLPKNVLRSIVRNLKFELYLPNDVIVKAGAQGDCMFFLSAGTVAVLTPTGKEICHLDDGAHFGEVALLVPDQRRVASVIAIEVCEVYRLERKDFRKCIAVHTELFAKIEKIATERIERAVIIEEQHKRFLMRNSAEGNGRRTGIV